MEDGTKGAAAVLDYQGGQVCNKYRSFFFFRVRPKSKENSGILWQLPLGQGSLMITQPQTNSANLTVWRIRKFQNLAGLWKNRSEESIHHGKEDDSAKWWVTMVPILGCPGKCRTSQGK